MIGCGAKSGAIWSIRRENGDSSASISNYAEQKLPFRRMSEEDLFGVHEGIQHPRTEIHSGQHKCLLEVGPSS